MRFIIPAVLILISCTPRQIQLPNFKHLDVTGTYKHYPSGISFPEQLADLQRLGITVYTDNLDNLSASYKDQLQNYLVTIYIYDAGLAHNWRLINEYYKVLRSMSQVSKASLTVDGSIHHFKFQGISNYGYDAYMENYLDFKLSRLLLFQCGDWFIKLRVSSKIDNKEQINTYSDLFLSNFNPVKIAQENPVDQNSPHIKIEKAAFVDSLTLNSWIAGAYTDAIWIKNNVDSLERNAGMPFLYLKQKRTVIDTMLYFWNSHQDWKSTNRYFHDLAKIAENNYINEMLLDEFGFLLIFDDSVQFKNKNYNEWKKANLPDFEIQSHYYLHYGDID